MGNVANERKLPVDLSTSIFKMLIDWWEKSGMDDHRPATIPSIIRAALIAIFDISPNAAFFIISENVIVYQGLKVRNLAGCWKLKILAFMAGDGSKVNFQPRFDSLYFGKQKSSDKFNKKKFTELFLAYPLRQLASFVLFLLAKKMKFPWFPVYFSSLTADPLQYVNILCKNLKRILKHLDNKRVPFFIRFQRKKSK